MTTALPFEVASEPDTHSGFEVLPAGQYPVWVTGVKNVTTKAGDGMYAKIEFTVHDDHPSKGRKVWANITVANKNAQAVAIGKRQLGELSYACGNTQPMTDLQQVYAKRCRVDLVVKTSDAYGPQNEVKSYHPMDGGQSLPAGAPTAGAENSSTAPKPWEQ